MDICHCPGNHPKLREWYNPESRVLMDKLYELRREHTNSWDVYSPPGERLYSFCSHQNHGWRKYVVLETFKLSSSIYTCTFIKRSDDVNI